jgi:hypothetical protein
MTKTKPGFTIRMTIERPPAEVEAFIRDLNNLRKWASGIDASAKVWFVEGNAFGVVDHHVIIGDLQVYVPMRAFPNEAATEVLITLFRRPEQDDAEFAQDTLMARRDLETLKKLLEQ